MKNSYNILVIHGFNSGPGNKSIVLKNTLPYYNIYTPQLNNKPLEDLNHLQEYIDTHTNIHIVGTSLGGCYTMYLMINNQHRDDIFYYPINPSFTPYNNFKDKLNLEFKNYKNSLIFKVNDKFLKELELVQNEIHTKLDNFACVEYFIGLNDELLDHTLLLSKLKAFKGPLYIKESNQDHRHENLDSIIKSIKHNSL